jgi:hypothetical protein
MGQTPKPGMRPTPRPVTTPPPSPPRVPPMPVQARTPSPVLDSPSATPPPEKPPYFKYAFANPYNMSLFLGALGASALTMNPLIALAAVGAEAIWLLNAPGSSALRRLVWDPLFARERRSWDAQQRANRIMLLNQADRQRIERLVQLKRDIQRLAAQNPSFSGELLRAELAKTDRLVDAFLDMAVTCARYEQYLAAIDLPELDAERERWDRAIQESGSDQTQTGIAKKNLAIIMKRFEKVQEIRRYLDVARGELDLIENSFRLLADQIVTMQSPHELSGQLDELLTSVEAIKESALDTERMLANAGITTTA